MCCLTSRMKEKWNYIRSEAHGRVHKTKDGNNLFSIVTWRTFQFCRSAIIENFFMALRSSWHQPYWRPVYQIAPSSFQKTLWNDRKNSIHPVLFGEFNWDYLWVQEQRRHVVPVQCFPVSSTTIYKLHLENYLQSKGKIQDFIPGVIALKILLIMKPDNKSVRFRGDVITFFFNLWTHSFEWPVCTWYWLLFAIPLQSVLPALCEMTVTICILSLFMCCLDKTISFYFLLCHKVSVPSFPLCSPSTFVKAGHHPGESLGLLEHGEPCARPKVASLAGLVSPLLSLPLNLCWQVSEKKFPWS